MDLIQAVLLGVLQGVTEWLPVSSSGHLALAQHFFNISVPVAFDVALHLGTLIAVVAFLWRDLAEMVLREHKTAALIVLASIPTAVIGFTFKPFFESMFSQPLLVGLALLATGLLLYFAPRIQQHGDVTPWRAFLVGIAQGAAVAPGISRSGSTIATALFLGVERKKAAKFSFLLAIPAVIGASFFELRGAEFTALPLLPVLAGIAAAAVVGFLSIGLLFKALEESKLHWFAYYCWLLGLAAIALTLA